MKTKISGVALLYFLSLFLPLRAQSISPNELLQSSKQSFLSIRPEILLVSTAQNSTYKKGDFKYNYKPGISIGYGKRYTIYKELGIELGIFAGITRFAYSAVAAKEEFPPRDYTFEHHESLVNPYISVPILLNYQKPINNKYLFTAFAGPNFKIYGTEDISSALSFSNAPDPFPTGEVFDVRLIFTNKPLTTTIKTGAGIGRMLSNHNILQLNLWADIGLKQRIRGFYNFYDQEWDRTGENIQNHIVGSGGIQSNGSMVGTEIRYTFTGIRKRLKALEQ